MKTAAIALTVLATAFAGAAAAQTRISDADYVQASRCHGLVAATGATDEGLAALLKSSQASRLPAVVERGRVAFSSAKRSGSRDTTRAQAELDKSCTAFRGQAAMPTG